MSFRAYSAPDFRHHCAITTYLLWLRVVHFAGHFTDEAYVEEQDRVRDFLERESKESDQSHLSTYLAEWERLKSVLRELRSE